MSSTGRTKGMNDERRAQRATSNSNANARHGTPTRFKGDDIAERLLDLAAGVVRLLPSLTKQPGATSLVKQLEPEWTESSLLDAVHGGPRARARQSPRAVNAVGPREGTRSRSDRCTLGSFERREAHSEIRNLTPPRCAGLPLSLLLPKTAAGEGPETKVLDATP